MAYREVTMMEVKEVLRLWLAGGRRKQIARRLGLDPKTVRRYLRAAARGGLTPGMDAAALTEERLAAVLTALRARCRAAARRGVAALRRAPRLHRGPARGRACGSRRSAGCWPARGSSSAATLYRFAIAELGFGRGARDDPGRRRRAGRGGPARHGLDDDAGARRARAAAAASAPGSSPRACRATASSTRASRETTESAIEACEAAWAFYGGIFRVLIPDNTKAIVRTPDPLQPRVVPAFLEYAQARGFVVDPARVRQPTDKARVERTVPYVRDDCFGGERLGTLEQARDARRGVVPRGGRPAPPRAHAAPAARALRGRRAAGAPARADGALRRPALGDAEGRARSARPGRQGALLAADPVRGQDPACPRRPHAPSASTTAPMLVKTHPRVAPGPALDRSRRLPGREDGVRAARRGLPRARGRAATAPRSAASPRRLLAGPLPWTRMRQVYALLGLVKRYGAARVEAACELALAAELFDVYRLRRMLAARGAAPGRAAGRA